VASLDAPRFTLPGAGALMPNNYTMIERFWQKVDVRGADECWEWTGARKPNGYGLLSLAGHNRVQLYAHRVSASIHFGMFHRKSLICHHCDNPPCVNPAHLYVGDVRTNAADMMRRGRGNGQFQRQTHCHRGHEFTPETTYTWNDGKNRECYVCKREKWLAGRERRYFAADIKAAAVADYVGGMPTSDLAAKYGADSGTFRIWAKAAGAPVRRVGRPR